MQKTSLTLALTLVPLMAMGAPLVPDQPTMFGQAEVVCTGVGSAKDNPQWSNYPIKMVFSNAAGQFISDVSISLSTSAGQEVGNWECDAPWALLRLPAGNYKADVMFEGMSRSASFSASAASSASYNGGNQKVIDVQFPLPANQ